MGRLKFCGRLTFFLQECGLTLRMPHKLSCVSLALPLIPPRCTPHHSCLYSTPPEWCHLPCGLDEHQADANIILYKPKNYYFFTVYPKYFSTLISSIKLAKRDDSSQNCPYSVTTAYVTVSAFPNKSILPKGPTEYKVPRSGHLWVYHHLKVRAGHRRELEARGWGLPPSLIVKQTGGLSPLKYISQGKERWTSPLNLKLQNVNTTLDKR